VKTRPFGREGHIVTLTVLPCKQISCLDWSGQPLRLGDGQTKQWAVRAIRGSSTCLEHRPRVRLAIYQSLFARPDLAPLRMKSQYGKDAIKLFRLQIHMNIN